MATEIKVPVLPESVSDATIATWHKKAGDAVKRDENLVDLETDKVVLEVPSTVDGVLKEIKFEEGATVNSAQVIAIIEEGAAAEAPAAESGAKDKEAPAAGAEEVQPKSQAKQADDKAPSSTKPQTSSGKNDGLPPGARLTAHFPASLKGRTDKLAAQLDRLARDETNQNPERRRQSTRHRPRHDATSVPTSTAMPRTIQAK